MSEQTKEHPEHKGEDYSLECGHISMERIRYFNGRYLNARDFRDEQAFHLSRRYLHNRLLHGWGVVCGLRVVPHPNPECRDNWVVGKAGVAIDCCGREVMVCEEEAKQLPKKEDWKAYGDKKLFLCLRYTETAFECVPVLDPDSTCDHVRKENSRIREGHELEWIWLSEEEASRCGWCMPKDCKDKDFGANDRDSKEAEQKEQASQQQQTPQQQTPQQHEKEPCPSDCDEVVPGGSPGCLEPCCPPNECILLAWIEKTDEGIQIRMAGRRKLPPPADYLTHVCDINWPHGGKLTLSEVQALKRLEVRFDRKLKDPDTSEHGRFFGPTGVNACTFIVQYGGRREDLDFVPYPKSNPPHQGPDGKTAVFDMDPDADLQRDNYRYLVGHTVFVTLLCDLIQDCRELSVDGNHLGHLPSGDGVEGGKFVSWFHVVDDSYPAGETKQAS